MASIFIYSKLCKKSVEIKLIQHFLRVSMRKRTSRIWVFLLFRSRRKQPPVWEKSESTCNDVIMTFFLTSCYPTSRKKYFFKTLF